MNAAKLLFTFVFVGLLATLSYFFLMPSEKTPEFVENESNSQDIPEFVRMPSVPFLMSHNILEKTYIAF